MDEWTVRIDRWDEDDAEIRVDVAYLDGDWPVHFESFKRPAGTPKARILEEIGARGRAARAAVPPRAATSKMIGQTFSLADL